MRARLPPTSLALLAGLAQAAAMAAPWNGQQVMYEALIASAIGSAERAAELGMPREQILLSCKVSGVQDLIAVYRALAQRCTFPLHLGLTEAGMGAKGTVASTAALAILLQEGIGETIRVSLTPEPGQSRTQEVVVAAEILQALGLRHFTPSVTACPGCGRTTNSTFQELAKQIDDFLRAQMPSWRKQYPDGLHRQRSRRKQARRYRHQPSRYGRNSCCTGIHRRRESHDPARRQYRGRIPVAGH